MERGLVTKTKDGNGNQQNIKGISGVKKQKSEEWNAEQK